MIKYLLIVLAACVAVPAEAGRCEKHKSVVVKTTEANVSQAFQKYGDWVYTSRGWVFCPGPNCPYGPQQPPQQPQQPQQTPPPEFDFPEEDVQEPSTEVVEEPEPAVDRSVLPVAISVGAVLAGLVSAVLASRNVQAVGDEEKQASTPEDVPPEVE